MLREAPFLTAVLSLLMVLPVTAQSRQPPSREVRTVQAPIPVPDPDVPLSDAEMDIAHRVHMGPLPCEAGLRAHMDADPQRPGHYLLQAGKGHYRLRPVPSVSGAVRLEDPQQGVFWLQLPHKSMLMHARLGRRLADGCVSPTQQAQARAMLASPAPSLLENPSPQR